jgi:hypothetical protein
MKFIPSIIEIYELAKVIADNGHGDKNQLRTWLIAEANRGAFPIHDTANGTDDVWDISLVEVEQVRPFLTQAMGFDPLAPRAVTTDAPEATPIVSAPEWKQRADTRAVEIIERDRARDLYPSKENIADEIAREFRTAGVMGAGGKPLAGSYIKRHALRGISSEQGRQLSTATRRGK